MNKAEAAGQKLMAAVMQGKSTESTDQIARFAMAQALVTQAAFQALLRCLAHKNFIGDDELVRFLAEAYESSYERLTKPGIIVPGAAMNGAGK